MQNEMRDRLVELIKQAKQNTKNANCDLERNLLFADSLIENGVVVLDTDVLLSEYRPLIRTIADMPLNEVIELIKAKREGRIIVPPCKVGDEVWVVEEDDVTCYMFLAKSKGCIIATSWINDYNLDETIEYHISETQDNCDTDLVVFPDECCFATKEEAEKALKEGADNG